MRKCRAFSKTLFVSFDVESGFFFWQSMWNFLKVFADRVDVLACLSIVGKKAWLMRLSAVSAASARYAYRITLVGAHSCRTWPFSCFFLRLIIVHLGFEAAPLHLGPCRCLHSVCPGNKIFIGWIRGNFSINPPNRLHALEL